MVVQAVNDEEGYLGTSAATVGWLLCQGDTRVLGDDVAPVAGLE